MTTPDLSEITTNKESQNLLQKHREVSLKEASSVVTILNDVKRKDNLERKAFEALDRRLTPKNAMCKMCKGDGKDRFDNSCNLCDGEGYVVEDASMKAIELVLAPKFPKTQVNINADLDNMGANEILGMIDDL